LSDAAAWLLTGLLILTTGGCSASGVVTDWNSDDVLGNEPVNYRYVVASQLSGVIGVAKIDQGILEISPPRRADWPKGPVWLVCLKSLPDTQQRLPTYYAIAFQREKIWDSRIAIGIDRCETQIYSPFDRKTELAHPISQ
jgi:hypothetical protein